MKLFFIWVSSLSTGQKTLEECNQGWVKWQSVVTTNIMDDFSFLKWNRMLTFLTGIFQMEVVEGRLIFRFVWFVLGCTGASYPYPGTFFEVPSPVCIYLMKIFTCLSRTSVFWFPRKAAITRGGHSHRPHTIIKLKTAELYALYTRLRKIRRLIRCVDY